MAPRGNEDGPIAHGGTWGVIEVLGWGSMQVAGRCWQVRIAGLRGNRCLQWNAKLFTQLRGEMKRRPKRAGDGRGEGREGLPRRKRAYLAVSKKTAASDPGKKLDMRVSESLKGGLGSRLGVVLR